MLKNCTAILFAALAVASIEGADFASGRFNIGVGQKPSTVTITTIEGDTLIAGNLPQWGVTERDTAMNVRHSLADVERVKVSRSRHADLLGNAERITLQGKLGRETVSQTYDIYPNFIVTQLAVESPDDISLNYLAPIFTAEGFEAFDRAGNYAVSIPYDNDAWVRYESAPFGNSHRQSYEVMPIFNADTRKGIVIGSLDHNIWKTAMKLKSSGIGRIDHLEVYSGAADSLTRDVRPHGLLTGKRIESARMLILPAADWRDGMETYADLCAAIAPRIASFGPRPFGWNSWGKLAGDITFEKAIEVSDFMHDNIQQSFHDADSTIYVDIDSFWDRGFKRHQHKEFVDHCHANGQRPGIYYCPFTDWGGNPECTVHEAPEYKMGDLYLRNNGEPIIFDGARALDPTHPGTKARIKRQIEQFLDWGYEYVKVDFMAHGAYESDCHYDPTVTTGNQAYSHGMAYLDSVIDGRMWINLSIAPLFPANFAHSRRISCDAWADIKNTEYVLNALSYGWWLDHVYHFNDADHIVYEGATDGENRARVTSSAITGVYFLGDDMSASGQAKDRVMRNTTNDELNEMARRCGSFRPVEFGHAAGAADMFMATDGDVLYLAIFNFGNRPMSRELSLRRLGLSESEGYEVTEIWSHDKLRKVHGVLRAEVPARDVKVYKFKIKE